MPANRSRTERWRDCLHQIYQRNGGLEFSFDTTGAAHLQGGPDLIWRVRILKLTDSEIVVERPAALGQSLPLEVNVALTGVMAIGQNRWMFRTRVLGLDARAGTMRVAMPATVERCRRREFFRVSTMELNPVNVTCWPLLNPVSVIAAEVANKAAITDAENGRMHIGASSPEMLPDVAPPFQAKLVNIGGGGVGLLVGKSEAHSVDTSRLVWLRLDLTPEVPLPIGMTARLVHSHLDSEQNLYLGGAFEFSFHAAHREFVVSQITRYVERRLARLKSAA